MKPKIMCLSLCLLLLGACGEESSSLHDVTSSLSEESQSESSASTSEEEVITIQEARITPQGEIITTEGIITGIYRDAKVGEPDTYSVALQDDDEAILLYGVTPEVLGDASAGHSYRVTGTLAFHFVTVMLTHVSEISPSSRLYEANPLVIDNIDAISDWTVMDSRLVTLKGLRSPYNEAINPSEDNYFTLWQNQGLVDATVFISQRLGEHYINLIKPAFDDPSYITKHLELTGIIGFNRGEPNLIFFNIAHFQTVNNEGDATHLELIASNGETSLKVGKTLRIVPFFTPAIVSSREVTWYLSDHNLGQIDQWGTLKAKAAGTLTITGKWTTNPEIQATLTIEIFA